jgi:hypothetical protein
MLEVEFQEWLKRKAPKRKQASIPVFMLSKL